MKLGKKLAIGVLVLLAVMGGLAAYGVWWLKGAHIFF